MIYKKFIHDKLSNDLKIKIWNIYKKKIALNIIRRFYNKYTDICSDCFRVNWIKNVKNIIYNNNNNIFKKNNFCLKNCCNNFSIMCCNKVTCMNSCKFKIICGYCKYKFTFIPLTTINLSEIKVKCFLCCKLNIIYLTWKNKICKMNNLTIEPDYNRFYYQNNKRYFYGNIK